MISKIFSTELSKGHHGIFQTRRWRSGGSAPTPLSAQIHYCGDDVWEDHDVHTLQYFLPDLESFSCFQGLQETEVYLIGKLLGKDSAKSATRANPPIKLRKRENCRTSTHYTSTARFNNSLMSYNDTSGAWGWLRSDGLALGRQ